METIELTNSLITETATDAICFRPSPKDFDSYTVNGYATVNAEIWTGHPTGAYKYGVLICYGGDNSFRVQEYLPHGKAERYWRVGHKGTWASWIMVQGTKLS